MKCCCICFSLRTGGIIIGVIDLVGGIIGAIGYAVLLGIFAVSKTIPSYKLDLQEDLAAKKRESFWDVTSSTTELANISTSTNENEFDNENKKYLATLLLAMVSILFYVMLVLCVVQMIIASFLLYGIRKQSISYMKVWLIFKAVFLVISIFAIILMTFAWSFQLKDIVAQVLAIALHIYFITVIYDLRKEIREQLENPHVVDFVKV